MKKFRKFLSFLLTVAILLGFALPLASANEPVEIVFVNPLAEIEPIDNMPIASRENLRQKLANGETVNLLALYYSKNNNAEAAIGLAEALRIALWDIFGENYRANGITVMQEAITITLAVGGTTLYSNVQNQPPLGPGTTAVLPYYWKNQGPLNENGVPESRVPFMGSPWGPKTGFGYTGFPSYEQNFERYASWASFDAVIFALGD